MGVPLKDLFSVLWRKRMTMADLPGPSIGKNNIIESLREPRQARLRLPSPARFFRARPVGGGTSSILLVSLPPHILLSILLSVFFLPLIPFVALPHILLSFFALVCIPSVFRACPWSSLRLFHGFLPMAGYSSPAAFPVVCFWSVAKIKIAFRRL